MSVPAAPIQPRLERLAPEDFLSSSAPRITWRSQNAGVSRLEIERRVGAEPERATIEGAARTGVAWPFPPVASRERGAVRVRELTDDGWSEWSDELAYEASLLHPDDWHARLIEAVDLGGIGEPAPVFERRFTLEKPIARARLYVSAHGVLEAELDGTRVGQDHLTPGWTAYQERLRFTAYDITEQILSGPDHHLRITVGNGWFRGRLGWSGARAFYGPSLGVIAQLEIETALGDRITIATDEQWTVGDGALMADDLYDGTTIDFTRSPREGRAVKVAADVREKLFPSTTRPVRELARWRPASIRAIETGTTLVDFGQNVTGWVSIKVTGGAGRRVEVRHAEVLVGGRLETRTLRSAQATDTYILDGRERTLEPSFTFHGFRYAEIQGIALEEIVDVEVVVIGSGLQRIGTFSCSDPRLNRLHENIVRSARSNLIDVPIDCPQRDERLGWTGDLQMFAPAGTFLFDMSAMIDSWLADLRVEQHADGSVPVVIPDILGRLISPGAATTAGFSDAAVLVPLAAYQAYGDDRAVAAQWPSALAWINRARELAGGGGIRTGGFQWGDWLDPSASGSDPSRTATPTDLIVTAMLAQTLEAGARLAAIADPGLVEHLESEWARIQAAFDDRFVTPDGLVVGDSVSSYVFALRSGALSATQRAGAGERLISALRTRGFRGSTGFLGTAQVLDALDEVDASDIAVRMLLTDRMPSWLAQVGLGATTVWERWDSMDEIGKINDPSMTSFNHYALGSMADWLHRRIGGLAPETPGYRTVRIAPIVTSEISSAAVSHDSAFGPISVSWYRRHDEVCVEVDLPAGVDAILDVPGLPATLPPGHHVLVTSAPPPIRLPAGRGRVAAVLDDPHAGPSLVATLVRIGAADDIDDAYYRLAPYADLDVAELGPHLAHPAFRATGPFVAAQFTRAIIESEDRDVRTY